MASAIEIRVATLEDVEGLRELEERVWENIPASKEMIASRINTFPDGNIIAVHKESNKIIGYLALMFLGYETSEFPHSWMEITGNGKIQNHDPNGKYMYGLNLSVDKGYSDEGNSVGMRLQIHGWCVAVKYHRRGCYLGSPIPGFASWKKKHPEMSAEDYVYGTRKNGNPLDPELAYYRSAGFKAVKVLENYEPDPASLDYGVLIYCNNPFYRMPFCFFIAWLIKRFGFKLLKMFGV